MEEIAAKKEIKKVSNMRKITINTFSHQQHLR